VLVHEGKGIDAVSVIDPQVSGVIKYITGKGNDGTPHYEVSGAVARMCSQNVQCQASNTMDLLVALSAYLEGPGGKKTLMDAKTLLNSQGIQDFLNSSAPNSLTEDGAVAIAKVAIPAIESASPDDLQNLLTQPPLNAYQTELQPIIDDVKAIMMNQALYGPLKKALVCLTWADSNYDLVRMLYRLGLRDMLPEFGITRLAQLVDNIANLDQRGALIHLLGTVAAAIRTDDTANASAASVCQQLFSTDVPPGQSKSNAELALPVVGDLFAAGVVSEVVCALDTLIYGCSGGSQPACENQPAPVDLGPAPVVATCPGNACCTHCGSKQPCGDGCIDADAICSESPGCACK
jgi:hypothetical protein